MSDPVPPAEFLEPLAEPNEEEDDDGLFVLPERPDPTQAPPHP
ncbi:hypothetical protein [Streptosporangium vulgare]|uniref:Uncharacterized protein n=1 Tax=Streptosporangium vulgare TaxID=46190 RepID=A0ABV5TQK9_9ACTN